jgi:hypothetical protein
MLRLLPCSNRENTASLCFFLSIFVFNFIIIIYFKKLIMKLSQFKKKHFNVGLKLSQTSQGRGLGVVEFTLNQPGRT